MASPGNQKRESSKDDSLAEDGDNLLEAGPRKKASSENNSSADNGNSCLLEAGPSRAFTNSTLRPSTSRGGTPQSSGRKKLSIRKLSVEATLDIPLNDDCNELIEEKEKSIAEQEKSLNKSSNKAEEEPDVSIVKTMTKEQMQEHVSRCLQLSNENVEVEPIRIVAKPNRVDMQHLKFVMLNIIRRAIEDRENQLKDEGLVSPHGSVAFKDVLTHLFSSEQLHHRTREDLTIQMAFLCLLTLVNENSFELKKDESEDFLIMYDPRESPR